jgi:LysR family hydrogen peroxide-inducible transcriptional activator
VELQQIRYFLALAEELNFRRAARRCNVSQPSVTNAIKALERELGAPLFRRQKPRIALSEFGHAVRPHLARIADEVDHVREAARSFVRDAQAASGKPPAAPSTPVDHTLTLIPRATTPAYRTT